MQRWELPQGWSIETLPGVGGTKGHQKSAAPELLQKPKCEVGKSRFRVVRTETHGGYDYYNNLTSSVFHVLTTVSLPSPSPAERIWAGQM